MNDQTFKWSKACYVIQAVVLVFDRCEISSCVKSPVKCDQLLIYSVKL